MELLITHRLHNGGVDIIMSSSMPPKIISNTRKIGGAYLYCVNNHYAKFEYKGMKTVGSYRLHKLNTILSILDLKNVLVNTSKNEKIFMKCA